MYKLVNNKDGSESSVIFRIADSVWIPKEEANSDYQAYLKWLEEGNTPEPADEQ